MAGVFADGTVWLSETASHTPWIEDGENLMAQITAFLETFR